MNPGEGESIQGESQVRKLADSEEASIAGRIEFHVSVLAHEGQVVACGADAHLAKLGRLILPCELLQCDSGERDCLALLRLPPLAAG